MLKGNHYLEKASDNQVISEYLIQASIAACHCYAPSFAETDWERILFLYDALVIINPSNIVRLNRSVALAKAKGAKEGLKTIEKIEADYPLFNYYLLHAVKAQLFLELNHSEKPSSTIKSP